MTAIPPKRTGGFQRQPSPCRSISQWMRDWPERPHFSRPQHIQLRCAPAIGRAEACALLLLFGFRAQGQRLYHFGQIRKRLLIFLGKGLLTLTARIGLLQRAEHGTRDGDRSASMVLFANQVKLLSCLLMAGEAVLAEAVVDVLETALIDFAAVLAYIDRKEFPVSGRGIESFPLFDHDFSWDQLYDRTFWVIAPALLGNGHSALQIAQQVVNVEVAHRRHVGDALKCVVVHFDGGFGALVRCPRT